MAINYGKGKNDLDYDLDKTELSSPEYSLHSAMKYNSMMNWMTL